MASFLTCLLSCLFTRYSTFFSFFFFVTVLSSTVLSLFITFVWQELADLLADSNSKNKVVLREDSKRGEATRMESTCVGTLALKEIVVAVVLVIWCALLLSFDADRAIIGDGHC